MNKKHVFAKVCRVGVLSGVLGGVLSLTPGCALMRNDAPVHAQIPPERIRLASDIHLARDGWPDAQWWTRYDDPQLDALIERALKGSPTLAAAQLRVAQSGSQVDLLRAGSNLQVSALGFLNEQHVSSNGFLGPYALNAPKLGFSGPWYTEGTVGLFAGLNVDIWGRQRSLVEAAIGARNARVAEEAAVELAISTEVAQLYFSMQASYRLLDLLRQTREVLAYAVQAHEGKAATGLEARVPMHGARGQLLGVDRQIAAAQGQITQTREMLRAVVGGGADSLPEIRPVALPQAAAGLPAVLSYQLLARRPDLQAMRWYVQSSLSEVQAAKAAFYPSIDIKAFFGLDTIQLSKLFRAASTQFNLIPGLYLPIFDGGRLNANLGGARAASNILIEQYNQAVLDAVRDVAVSGSRLQTLDEERGLQADKVEAARFAQEAADAAYRRGLASRLSAEEARLPLLAEQTALLLLDGERLGQDLILTRALGGGYEAQDVAQLDDGARDAPKTP
ncbi:MdtP family multidrug efflux transporter outer membrane subunit [Paraburkholderia unamae]|uniref:Multidrug efflux system outer membrane protein n=1 Tax=Paraburkholderia unamae TaxID=219649 RepID=A0ABX5K8Z8_9BURK|nr:MdtP family multidrug efflux transporter outer membrane subunit [Paraburkholderia unamae]PVX70955.1 multidrug efflux system outer membrane protein [Paraburkholderia unamae]CAG9253280.1 putative multidrug efflux pump outer membrane channel [Paraburkholderia unamae]